MEIFFIADTHFGHTNIIKYCERPFETVEEHDDCIKSNWNDKIPVKKSKVYILGDFAFKSPDKFIRCLHGSEKILIRGNHDHYSNFIFGLFTKVYGKENHSSGFYNFQNSDYCISLSHFPMASWHRVCHGSWHLHGHCHGNMEGSNKNEISAGMRYDVGVDTNNFTPLHIDEISEIMKQKETLIKEKKNVDF